MKKLVFNMIFSLILVFAFSSCSLLSPKPAIDQTGDYYSYDDDQIIGDGSGYFGLSTLLSDDDGGFGMGAVAETDTDTDSEEEEYVNPYSIWASVYDEYSSLCDHSYNRLIEVTEKNGYYGPDTNFLLNGNAELSLCSSFFSKPALDIESEFQAIGYTSVKYRENGPNVTIIAVDTNGKNVTYSFEFDGENSAQLICERDDQLEFTMSICVAPTYWAKVYKGIKEPCEIHIVGNRTDEFFMFYEPEKSFEHDLSLLAHEEIALDDAFIEGFGYSMILNNENLIITSPDSDSE